AGKPPTPVADGPSCRGSQTAQNGPASMDSQHLMVPVRLYPPGGPWILTHALVDSGATRSYMDAAFAAHHQVPLRNKPVPVQVEAIDGRLLCSGAVTQETQPLVLCFQQHRELRTLDIASMPRFPWCSGWTGWKPTTFRFTGSNGPCTSQTHVPMLNLGRWRPRPQRRQHPRSQPCIRTTRTCSRNGGQTSCR
ncbi:retrotransposon nucleocapsid, partial [Podarcis lilfordi]